MCLVESTLLEVGVKGIHKENPLSLGLQVPFLPHTHIRGAPNIICGTQIWIGLGWFQAGVGLLTISRSKAAPSIPTPHKNQRL